MNREELEKEAEEYYYKTYPVTLNIGEEERKKEVTNIFVKGAESREKQIQALGERCLQLQADKGRLTDENRQAKEIIRNLLGCLEDFDEGTICFYKQSIDEAEAFLKE